MSRLAKKPINIPIGVEVKQDDGRVNIKGSRGTLGRDFRDEVKIEVADAEIKLSLARSSRQAKILLGTYASHLKNMIAGVTQGFEKKLMIEGIGYRATVASDKLTLNLGFSHPVELFIPEGVETVVEKNLITIKGCDKEVVGQFAANIRASRPPEPYKGKGIRYVDEVVRRKAGKKVVA